MNHTNQRCEGYIMTMTTNTAINSIEIDLQLHTMLEK